MTINYSQFPFISTNDFASVTVDVTLYEGVYFAMLSFFKEELSEEGKSQGFVFDTPICGDTLGEVADKIGALIRSGLFDCVDVCGHGLIFDENGDEIGTVCWLHEAGLLDQCDDEEDEEDDSLENTITISRRELVTH